MSDNGVVVLQTKDVVGSEFRVAYVDDVDSLYGMFNDNTGQWEGDSALIFEYFFECDIYTDEEAALTFAADLAAQTDYLENGIMVLRDFKDMEFYKL